MADLKGEIKYYVPHDYEGTNTTKTRILTPRVSRDQTFESVKSEISGEIGLPLGNVNFEVNARTESSCSDSLSVNFPVPFSNQDTSKKAGAVGKSSFCSDISDNFNCTSTTVENVISCDEIENLHTPHSGERMIKQEISGEGENISGVKGKYESSESSMTKSGKVFVKDRRNTFLAEFDLNEEVKGNRADDIIQPVVEHVYSHSVRRVVAKAGIPRGRPVMPLEFEGGLGWKGSAGTSAFRPSSISKSLDRKICSTNHRPTGLQRFTGIDLNVAAVEDLQSESLCFDLNRLYDGGDEFTQRSSVSVKLENAPLLDLNLNVNTLLGDKSNNVHRGNKISDPANQRNPDFNPVGRDHLPSLSTMQHLAYNASFQPKLPFLSPTFLPLQSYPSNGPLHFGKPMPYIGYSHGHSILPGLYNPAMVHNSFATNRPQQVFYEQSTSIVKTEDKLSTSGSKTNETRQFLFLDNKSPMGERLHQDDRLTTSVKRKDTEGGLEFGQIGYKRAI